MATILPLRFLYETHQHTEKRLGCDGEDTRRMLLQYDGASLGREKWSRAPCALDDVKARTSEPEAARDENAQVSEALLRKCAIDVRNTWGGVEVIPSGG